MTPLIRLTPVGATIVVKQLSSSLRTLDLANVVRVEERSKAELTLHLPACMCSPRRLRLPTGACRGAIEGGQEGEVALDDARQRR